MKDIIIFLILIILEKIYCFSNHNYDIKFDFKFNDPLIEDLTNKNDKNNWEDIFSRIQSDLNKVSKREVRMDEIPIDEIYENLDEEDECLKYFFQLDKIDNKEINEKVAYINDETFDKMPEHCQNQFNSFFKAFIESAYNQMPNDSDFVKFLNSNNINFNNKCKKEKYHTIHDNEKKKKTKPYDDELEQYYIKSRKDCVEYGLKSDEEDIIVCTKYE